MQNVSEWFARNLVAANLQLGRLDGEPGIVPVAVELRGVATLVSPTSRPCYARVFRRIGGSNGRSRRSSSDSQRARVLARVKARGYAPPPLRGAPAWTPAPRTLVPVLV